MFQNRSSVEIADELKSLPNSSNFRSSREEILNKTKRNLSADNLK